MLLFNYKGSNDVSKRRVIKGETTRLFNLNKLKYDWAKSLYRVMLGNHWIPEKVSMKQDVLDFSTLPKVEQLTFKRIISFLTFLDSIQTNNIPNIKNSITAPEISVLLSIQEFQEVVHSQSYAYVLESVINDDKERDKIYELWRSDTKLFERNKYIADIYQDFIDNPNDISLAKGIIANYILEGLYFYNGFIFFYNLSSRKLMQGTADEIRYIQRDEHTHITLFANIINEIKNENLDFFPEEMVYLLFEEGVKSEIEWTNHALAEGIVGMDKSTTEQYTKYLANKRLMAIGFKPLYENVINPYENLEKHADESQSGVKVNFFEATVTNYSDPDLLDGWDLI